MTQIHTARMSKARSAFTCEPSVPQDPLQLPATLLDDTHEALIIGDIAASIAAGNFREIISQLATVLPSSVGWLNSEYRLLYGAALEAWRRGQDLADGASLTTLCEKHGLNAGRGYDLLACNLLPHAGNWRGHAEALADNIARRKLFTAACKAISDLKCPSLTREVIVQNLAAVTRAATPADTTVEPVDVPPNYLPMPTSCLPAAAQQYLRAVAEALPCAEEAVALPLLAALGSAIGNSRRIALKSSWSEPAVIWAVTIMSSGKLKSPAHEAAVKFLARRQGKLIGQHKQAMTQYRNEQTAWDDDRLRARRSRQSVELSPPPEMPVCQRLTTADCTVEALAELLEENPRGLLVQRDELAGWLGSFDRYASNSGGDLPAWLSMHRAGSVTVDRKTGKKLTYVEHAHVNICGTIQPATLQRCLTPEFFDSGLSARLLMAMPPAPPKRWSEAVISPCIHAGLDQLFDRLLALEPATLTDADGQTSTAPIILGLSPQARDLWVEFYNQHAAEQETMNDERQSAAWSKLEAYAARFALIFTLCHNPNSTEIDAQSMADAITLTRWFGHETRRVYGMLSGQETDNPRAELIGLIHARFNGRVTARDLAHACRKYRAPGAAETALQELVSDRRACWETQVTAGGRRVMECVIATTGNAVTVTQVPQTAETETSVTVTAVTTATAPEAPTHPGHPEADPDSVPFWLEEVTASGCRAMECVSMTTGNAVTVTQVPKPAETATSVTVTAVTAVTAATDAETPPRLTHPDADIDLDRDLDPDSVPSWLEEVTAAESLWRQSQEVEALAAAEMC